MIRKSAVLLVMTMSLFMLYGGCNGDGGGTTDDTPPGAGVPGICDDCPCKYFDVPMIQNCWSTFIMGSTLNPAFDSVLTSPTPLCVLVGGGNPAQIQASNPCEDASCDPPVCRIEASTLCTRPRISVKMELANDMEIKACIDCLEEYARKLNSIVSVDDHTQGFSCSNPKP